MIKKFDSNHFKNLSIYAYTGLVLSSAVNAIDDRVLFLTLTSMVINKYINDYNYNNMINYIENNDGYSYKLK